MRFTKHAEARQARARRPIQPAARVPGRRSHTLIFLKNPFGRRFFLTQRKSKETVMSYTNVTDDNSDAEVLQASSSMPVLVDFWAPWCGPCRMLSPLIEEAAEEMAGKLKVCKYNCDESGNVAAELGIRSIPTVIIYRDGKPVSSQIGAVSKDQLTDWIQSNL